VALFSAVTCSQKSSSSMLSHAAISSRDLPYVVELCGESIGRIGYPGSDNALKPRGAAPSSDPPISPSFGPSSGICTSYTQLASVPNTTLTITTHTSSPLPPPPCLTIQSKPHETLPFLAYFPLAMMLSSARDPLASCSSGCWPRAGLRRWLAGRGR
jgi:hypothetical protein